MRQLDDRDSKRSDEMHEENALKMKERNRYLWIKMMNILKLKSELKSINIKIDETKKRLLGYCQQQQRRQQQQQQQQYKSDSDIESMADSSCLLYTSPSPRDATLSRMPSSA